MLIYWRVYVCCYDHGHRTAHHITPLHESSATGASLLSRLLNKSGPDSGGAGSSAGSAAASFAARPLESSEDLLPGVGGWKFQVGEQTEEWWHGEIDEMLEYGMILL